MLVTCFGAVSDEMIVANKCHAVIGRIIMKIFIIANHCFESGNLPPTTSYDIDRQNQHKSPICYQQ
jgi:hypothetical protein